MATKAQIKFTYEDYKSLTLGERERYELLEGELVMAPSPVPYHQIVLRNIEDCLWEFVRSGDLGEVLSAPCDVVLAPDAVVQPDLLFLSRSRASLIGKEAVEGAPDLIVEVLSPSTAQRDRIVKRKLYAKYGVQEYWIVDPEGKTVEVLTLGTGGYERAGLYTKSDLLESPLLAGLKISLAEVF
jgi:Uma2 family endonuclease